MEALAFEHNRQHIDIYSCSWGPEDSGWTMGGPGKLANEQLQEGAKTVSMAEQKKQLMQMSFIQTGVFYWKIHHS